MKKYLIIFVVGFLMSCSENPEIKFDYTAYDFGELKQNTQVSHVFKFTNTGKSPLIIKDIHAG